MRLPNGLVVFNATPHVIRFWQEGWPEPIEVETDTIVSAKIEETPAFTQEGVEFVRMTPSGTEEGQAIVEAAKASGMLVIGSIISAQAYPGDVVAMTPAPGYERVRPAEKRMRPDKFTVF